MKPLEPFDVWVLNYRSGGVLRVKVFDDELAALRFAADPPCGVVIIGRPWNLSEKPKR